MTAGALHGKNVVVIGGTSGIGLATALGASQQGANVWAAGRSAAHIEKATAAGAGRIKVVSVDTHDEAALKALFAEVGVIDHLVSAATGGSRTLKPFLEQTEDQFKDAFGKLWGYAKVVRTGAPFMAKTGSITLVSGAPARKIKANSSCPELRRCCRRDAGTLPGVRDGADPRQRGVPRHYRYGPVRLDGRGPRRACGSHGQRPAGGAGRAPGGSRQRVALPDAQWLCYRHNSGCRWRAVAALKEEQEGVTA
jgi:NAD(P)-dependent dehydrogenase (short-subunit alcohol dehydrogenase family)